MLNLIRPLFRGALICFSFFRVLDLFAAGEEVYSIFNPKPNDMMRPLNTDRPTKAPTPYSIDGGHLLFETDVVNYSVNTFNSNLPKIETTLLINSALRLGVLDWAEIQFSPPAYTFQNSSLNGFSTGNSSGFGDAFVRTKLNFIGNNSGILALALMPYLKIPTPRSPYTNGAVEGGVTLPGAIQLPDQWSIGWMLDWDSKLDSGDASYHSEGQGSVFVSRSWLEDLSNFLEFYVQKSFQSSTVWVVMLDAGIVYKVTSGIQLDLDVDIGLNSAAPAFNPFLGFSVRL